MEDNIVEETLSVVLENGVAKNIPFNTLDYNYIIGFDAVVEITHDKPVLQGYRGNIQLTSAGTVSQGDTLEITAQLMNIEGTPYKEDDITVYFFKEE